MRDLLPILNRAMDQARIPTERLIQQLKETFVVDWEEGDENWASCFENQRKVAIVGIVVPVIFVQPDFVEVIRNMGEVSRTCVIVEISDFAQADWRIDLQAFKNTFPEMGWNADPHAVNPNALSIDDFWYATIH